MSEFAGNAASAGSEFPEIPRAYRVFLSYSHADAKWANWLFRRLERFTVPRRLHGRRAPIGVIGRRIAPVFRDRDELPTAHDLGETIRDALRRSATLVVIGSPAAAKSRWVNEEILAFKRLRGSERVFAFIVAGEPGAEIPEEECFPPALRFALDAASGMLSANPAEVLAADARTRGDGRSDALIRLVSGLLGVGFDELRRREMQRRYRRMTWVAAGSAAGMAIMVGLAVIAWQARNDARRRQGQAEDVLTFMVGNFRAELKKLGRLTLLDDVGEKAMAYFDSLNPRDLTDTALTQQAKALTQIGENRIEEAHYPEAERAFRAAYARAAALVARHPQNGDMLFERAQAEYWIGFVYLRQGDFAATNRWFTRYRDSAAALVALDGTNARWRRELIAGHHNLAVLDLDRGELAAARTGFLSEMAAVQKLSSENPGDRQLQFRITDVDSWLGTVADRSGNFAEAGARFAVETAGLERLVKLEPDTAHWSYKLADSLLWEVEVSLISGETKVADQRLARASGLLEELVARDSANRRWLSALMRLRLIEAMIEQSQGGAARAALLVADVRPQLEKLVAAEPQDRTFALRLMEAWRLEAELRLAAAPEAAAAAGARAMALGEPWVREARADEGALGEYAQACVTAGRIAGAAGHADEAARCWSRAIDVVGARISSSNNWRLLDPAARALACLGRAAESHALVERLRRLGCRPLEPWPDVGAQIVSVSNHNPLKN